MVDFSTGTSQRGRITNEESRTYEMFQETLTACARVSVLDMFVSPSESMAGMLLLRSCEQQAV